MPEILCRCSDKGYPANINVFQEIVETSASAEGFLERVKVAHDHVYKGYAELLDISQVKLEMTSRKYSPEN